MSVEIVAKEYTETLVGKHIKRSKVNHTWKAVVDSIEMKIELLLSKISKKVRIKVNSNTVLYVKREVTPFRYSFTFRSHKITIAELPTRLELSINDVCFNNLLEKKNHKTLLRSQTERKNNPFDVYLDCNIINPTTLIEDNSRMSLPAPQWDPFANFQTKIVNPQDQNKHDLIMSRYSCPRPFNTNRLWAFNNIYRC